jgi:hypothetical protein
MNGSTTTGISPSFSLLMVFIALFESPRRLSCQRTQRISVTSTTTLVWTTRLGCLSSKNQVVWVNGPFPAGENDISIFKNRGLREMVPEGSWAIAYNGYRGLLTNSKIRTSSSIDAEAVRRLKSGAKAQHERFNGKLKNFAVVLDRWCHKINKHAIAFKAVCAICQYQMENGSPLWGV